MKKKYNQPSIVCVRFYNELSLCTTSEIEKNGKTDHFDARTNKWLDDE